MFICMKKLSSSKLPRWAIILRILIILRTFCLFIFFAILLFQIGINNLVFLISILILEITLIIGISKHKNLGLKICIVLSLCYLFPSFALIAEGLVNRNVRIHFFILSIFFLVISWFALQICFKNRFKHGKYVFKTPEIAQPIKDYDDNNENS